MLTTYLFRYTSECTISQSNFQNFLRLTRQRGIDPPNQNPAAVPDVEELVLPTPFLDFPGNALGGAGKTRFFGHKYLTDQLTGVYFGSLIEDVGAHSPDIFGMWEILVTR